MEKTQKSSTTDAVDGGAVDVDAAAVDKEKEGDVPQQQKPSKEDLIDLIRAIKFAKPDASQSQVHKEITTELSTKEGGEILKDVHIHDIKKVWKKAMTQQPAASENKSSSTNASGQNQDLKEKLQSSDGPVQVFTVGNATVKHLAKEYTAQYIASQMAVQAKIDEEEAKDRTENYVYVFLNVPADKSGSRPHQALIHFPKNGGAAGTTKGVKSSNNKKKGGKKKKGGSGATASKSTTDDSSANDNNIVKIQMAQSDDPAVKYPMLIYNKSRTAKTFIHPSDDGYDKIQEWIMIQGIGGTLGSAGGTKAYFYANVLSYNRNKESAGDDDILQIQVTELAPNQEW